MPPPAEATALSNRFPDAAVSGTKVAPASFVTSNLDGFRCRFSCDGGDKSSFGLACTAILRGRAFRV